MLHWTCLKVNMLLRELLSESWSDKYKRSINCASPKGFSQRAHCQGRKKNEDVQLDELNISQTLDFIKKAHGDQLYGKLPYWTHPRAVAMTGKKIFGGKFNSDAVKVAFLHDVVEDTSIGLDELSKLEFSPQVIQAVGLLTKDKTLAYSQNIERIINSGNPLAMMVKYADNYENFTGDKSSWDPKRAASSQKKYLASLNMLGDKLGVKHHVGEDHDPNQPKSIPRQATDPRYNVNEFAADDDSDEEHTLLKYARMWYNGNSHTQYKIEKILDRMGWEIGKIESDEGGAFVVRSGDENGNTYIGFAQDDLSENFADGRNPQDKGDSKRHGINTKASISSLRKTAKQGGRKGQLAHWLANMKSGRKKANESIGDKFDFQVFKDFFPIAMKVLEIDKLPKINLVMQVNDTEQPTFGRFDNNNLTIDLGMANRHPIDILRTLAHELVHFRQHLNGQLKPNSGETGSPEENEAHEVAGVIMRHFNKAHRHYFHSKPLEL